MNHHCRDAAERAASIQGLRVHLVHTPEQMREVFDLRYRAYRAEGVIADNPSRMFMDRYDLLRTSLLFGVSDGSGSLVGSMRFALQPPRSSTVDSFVSTPEFLIFPDELADLVGDGELVVSGARLSIDPGHPQRSEIAMLLMCAVLHAADAIGAKWSIATARGGHIRFYRRLLGMEQICPPRRMPGLTRDYALLAADVDLRFQDVASAFPATFRDHFAAAAPRWAEEVAEALGDVLTLCRATAVDAGEAA